MHIQYKWTIIFLIQSLDNSLEDMKKMMEDILLTQINKQVSVIIVVTINKNRVPPHYPVSLSSNEETQTTLCFQLIKQNNRVTLNLLSESFTFRLNKPVDLADFFNDTILKKYNAEHYLLFTWDHGHPFGIFEPAQNIFLENYLTTSKLKSAIEKSIKKIDIVVMNNCFCQFFDTGYELRKSIEFLIVFMLK